MSTGRININQLKMGGGNLNLKKSWHPSTIRNQEKVWKAEQQDEDEKRKVAELQKELQEQRDKEEFQVKHQQVNRKNKSLKHHDLFILLIKSDDSIAVFLFSLFLVLITGNR